MAEHTGFIVAAYAVTVIALAGTVIAIVADYRTQRRAVARLSSRLDPAAADRETP